MTNKCVQRKKEVFNVILNIKCVGGGKVSD